MDERCEDNKSILYRKLAIFLYRVQEKMQKENLV